MSPDWTPTHWQGLVGRLLADLARERGLTVAQVALHYALPPHPPMHSALTMEAPR